MDDRSVLHDDEFQHAMRTAAGPACCACRYLLNGLAPQGRCPECGQPYTLEPAPHQRRFPAPLEIIMRFGWPVAGFIACAVGVMNVRSLHTLVLLVLGGAGFALVTLVNSVAQVGFIRAATGPRTGLGAGDLPRYERVMAELIACVVLSFLAPMITYGACVIFNGF